VLLSAIFGVAGVTKLLDQSGTREAVINFGAPKSVAPSVAILLPLVELSIAVGLLFTTTAWWSAMAALLVLGIFVVAIGVNLARGNTHECHCFGQIYSRPLGWPTLVRNMLFALAAVTVLWNGQESQASIVSSISQLSSWQVLLLVAGLTIAAAGIFFSQRRQKRQVVHEHSEPIGLPLESEAPAFDLPEYEGGRTSLQKLLGFGKPILLIFTNPKCGPCIGLFKEIKDWQTAHNDQLTIVLITIGTIKDNFVNVARNGLGQVLLQEKSEVAELYGGTMTPSAVIVDPQGRIASRVAAGAGEIRALLQTYVQPPVASEDNHHHRHDHSPEPSVQPSSALR
jgi:peroxiredoxin